MSMLLARLRLQYQIGLIGLVGLLGLCVFGVLYYSGTLAQGGFQDAADRTAAYQGAITDVDRAIAEVGRADMAFLLLRRESDVDQHGAVSREASKRLEQMEAALRGDGATELADDVAKIRVGFARYVAQFIAVAQDSKTVGLDEESGLLGRLRKAVREAETAMQQVDEPRLLVWMLMMRRHEKDFLARHGDGKGEKYMAEMKAAKTKFDETSAPRRCRTSSAPPSPTRSPDISAIFSSWPTTSSSSTARSGTLRASERRSSR